MCGLVGMAGLIDYKHRKAFKKLLQLDTARGPHSTGVATIKKDGSCYIDKSLGTPWDWEKNHLTRFTKGVPDHGAKVLIGHNRWATVGAISAENAHPFMFLNDESGKEEDFIVGAHNGTLTKAWLNNLDFPKDFETDSEQLYANLHNDGLKKVYPKMHGAWALTFFEGKDEQMKFIRNKERPLFMCFTKDRKVLMWASEQWMIAVAAKLNDIEMEQAFQIESNKLYTYKIPKNEKNLTKLRKTGYLFESFTPPAPKKTHYKNPGSNLGGNLIPFGRGGVLKDHSSKDIGAIAELHREYNQKLIPFYMTEPPKQDNYYCQGEEIGEMHTVEFMVVKKEIMEHLNTPKAGNGMFFGEVMYVRKDVESPTGFKLVIKASSVTQEIPWTSYEWIVDHRIISEWLAENNILTLEQSLGVDTPSTDMSKKEFDEIFSVNMDSLDDFEPVNADDYEYRVGNNQYVDSKTAQGILDVGCGFCSQGEVLENIDDILWLQNSNSFLCTDCANNHSVKEQCMIH